MPTVRFSTEQDALYLKRRAGEQIRLYCTPRRWLVNDDTITLNIYGEPGTPILAEDGQTSIPATRQFTSLGSDFVAAGVLPSDVLEIQTPACNDGDNGRYQVNQVISPTVLEITEDWPAGSLTDLVFQLHFLPERYTEHPQLVPFQVKLEPTQKELDKWGIQEKRDARIVLSTQVCEDIALTPKIGDRFVFRYGTRFIHYEIVNLYNDGSIADSGIPLWWVGFANRTTNRLP
jgi:hypothetical protein